MTHDTGDDLTDAEPPPIEDHPEFDLWLDGDWQLQPEGGAIWHLGGIGWNEVNRHHWWQGHTPQTRGFDFLDDGLFERCSCGRVRFDGTGRWRRL